VTGSTYIALGKAFATVSDPLRHRVLHVSRGLLNFCSVVCLTLRARFCSMVEASFAFYHVGTFLPGRVELCTFATSTAFYHAMETHTVVASIILFYPAPKFPVNPYRWPESLMHGRKSRNGSNTGRTQIGTSSDKW
jgi:hypothetical protein